jgi:CRP-like cAMP-binding protein
MRLNRDPKLAFLRMLPLFADCTPEELRTVAAIADEISVPIGKRLITEGAEGNEFVVIVSGTAAVFKRGEKVAELGPRDFVGEIALLTGRPRSATVVATSPVVLLVVARPPFKSLIHRLPGVQAHFDAIVPAREAS